MADKVFLNDKIIEAEQAGISISDSGFLYGIGLFETMQARNAKVFAIDDHLERLFDSAKTLSINNTYEKDFIKNAIAETLKANDLAEARLRLTLTGGRLSASDEEAKSTLLIAATKLQGYPSEYYKNGVLAVLCPYRQNITDPTCGHKTTNYFARMHALDFARKLKAFEALWFTIDNRLAEGCISNCFIVKDSVLYTPKKETPVLAGVARKHIIEIAGENSIKVVEKDLGINDLLAADEVFLTNVIIQVLPVTRIEKHVVGKGEIGQITGKMQKYFEEFIKAQTQK